MDFRWIPGRGIDLNAVERMKQHFPKPNEAPREAWFMDPSNQWYFDELLTTPIEQVETDYLTKYLSDTGYGIKNFGRFNEWVVWYQYLLPYLLTRIHQGVSLTEGGMELLELTGSYFINLYPDGLTEEYPGFREDVLLTIPQSIMETLLWDGNDLAKEVIVYDEWVNTQECSLLYAAMFFCLKYLSTDEIPGWVASMAAVQGEQWRQQLANWLSGESRFLDYLDHPEKIPDELYRRTIKKGTLDEYLEVARINWADSYIVFRGQYSKRKLEDYVSKANTETFWDEVLKHPELPF